MACKLRHSSYLRACVWVTPCIAAWSLIPRLASNTGGLDSHQYLLWSSLVSAATLMLCASVMGHGAAMRAYLREDFLRLIALASLGTFGYYALLYSAYAPCPAGECPGKPLVIIIAQYTWPALSVLWAAVLRHEPLSGRMIVSLGIGLMAVWFGASTGGASGDAVAKLPVVLLAALIFGLYSTLLKRIDYEPFSSLALSFSAATLMSLVAAACLSERWQVPGWKGVDVWPVLVNGMFVNGLSYVCWYRALRTAPITFVMPWIALTPLIAAMLTPLHASSDGWIGIALVLFSVLLATLPSGSSSKWTRWISESAAMGMCRAARNPTDALSR
jgi:drug/metabolite transporter (DMT)-like permease